jgi:phytoene synthase
MINNMSKEIMEEYSTTFIQCVMDFPDEIRSDIYDLYAYLRVVDEMVEQTDNDKIYNYGDWRDVIENFHRVSDKYLFEGAWLSDFHASMFTDVIKKEHTVVSMLDYCKGSAEAVGCMMSRILGAPPDADEYARSLGRAYQIINFVRDYEDDISRGYHYINDNFAFYCSMFKQDLEFALKGIQYIPEHLRGPIYKANNMYLKVAEEHL